MKRNIGFTLVELLVVIAIISILAAIVVPRVTDWIDKANMAKGVAEVRGIDLALTKVMSDAGRSSMRAVFAGGTLAVLSSAQRNYGGNTDFGYNAQENSRVLYELMRRGRDAEGVQFAEGVQAKLGTSYMDLPQDPWKERYQFIPGPWPSQSEFIQVRSFRLSLDPNNQDIYSDTYQPYVYDLGARQAANDKTPGNPKADGFFGYPASKDAPFYVWSRGKNKVDDQLWNLPTGLVQPGFEGGGDDINNWDNQSGWETFYG
jgi:prepilin-type N-terminal cleavage/methylation domain-containing protein